MSISHRDRAEVSQEGDLWKAAEGYRSDPAEAMRLQACGDHRSTVGGNKKAIQEYIRNQEEEDIMVDQLSFRKYEDPFKNLEKDDDSPEVSTDSEIEKNLRK